LRRPVFSARSAIKLPMRPKPINPTLTLRMVSFSK
jgi:hypothetical protein